MTLIRKKKEEGLPRINADCRGSERDEEEQTLITNKH